MVDSKGGKITMDLKAAAKMFEECQCREAFPVCKKECPLRRPMRIYNEHLNFCDMFAEMQEYLISVPSD